MSDREYVDALKANLRTLAEITDSTDQARTALAGILALLDELNTRPAGTDGDISHVDYCDGRHAVDDAMRSVRNVERIAELAKDDIRGSIEVTDDFTNT